MKEFTAKTIEVIKIIAMAVIRFLRDADMFIFVLGLICSVFGIVMISSVTSNFPVGGYVTTQINALFLGIAFFVVFSYIDIDIIADRSWALYIFSILFILSLYIWGEGDEEWGNKAWLRFWGIGIQPAEVVKIIFAIIIARMLYNYKEKKTLNSVVSMMQIVLVFGSIFGAIVLVSSDLGSALIFAFMLIVMMFVAGVRLRWFAIGFALIAAFSPLIYPLLTERQQQRIVAPFIPNVIDPTRQGVLWQANQSLRAIQNGGFTGQGLGNGDITQANIIPEQQNDFIFSAVGEELGFIGALVVIALLTTIIARCFYVGVKSNNPLGMLVCIGIAAKFIAQTLENIGMCLGLLPVIGINLPFFSYGGSSLVTSFAAIGLVSGIKMRPKPIRFSKI